MQLASLQTSSQKYVFMQLDGIAAFARHFNLDLTHEEDRQILTHLQSFLLKHLSPKASAVVLDPNYGFTNLGQKYEKSGLIFPININDQDKKNQLPQLFENWGVENIRNNYAAAQLELYYHPSEEQALAKKQIAAELYDFCQYEKIAFNLQLRLFNPDGGILSETDFASAQLEAVQEFRKSCDLIALQYPGSALAAATISAELDIPWLLLAHEDPSLEKYPVLKERFREVLESGAAGVSLSSVLWDYLKFERMSDLQVDWQTVEEHIRTESRDRLVELSRIVEESN